MNWCPFDGPRPEEVLALQCLRLITEPDAVEVFHEHRDDAPCDDVVFVGSDRVDCFQVKAAVNDRSFLTLVDLLGESKPGESVVEIKDLYIAWQRQCGHYGHVSLSVFTNRLLSPDLAAILTEQNDNHERRFLPGLTANERGFKRVFERLMTAAGCTDAAKFSAFLQTVRFLLGQPSLEKLHGVLVQEYLGEKLGIRAPERIEAFFDLIRARFLQTLSLPIKKGEIRRVLGLDVALLPQTFKPDAAEILTRQRDILAVSHLIDEHASGYVAVLGPPGIGKSTLLSTYIRQRARSRTSVALHYFAFVSPLDDEQGRRGSLLEFCRSLREQAFAQFPQLIEKRERYNDTPERLHELLRELGCGLLEQGKKLVIIVDGIDHVVRADLHGNRPLFAGLPFEPPPNVIFLLGGQSLDGLDPRIRDAVAEERVLRMRGFSVDETSACVKAYRPESPTLSSDERRRLYEVTQGLPLYAVYVGKAWQERTERTLMEVLSELPQYRGSIHGYYGWLWQALERDPAKLSLCACLARLDFPVTFDELGSAAGLAPGVMAVCMRDIRPLLRSIRDKWLIFHDGFRQFVLDRSTSQTKEHADDLIFTALAEGRIGSLYQAFAYARRLNRIEFVRTRIDRNFVETSLTAGVPARTIREALRAALDIASINADIRLAARCCRLLTDLESRLFYLEDARGFRTDEMLTRASDRVIEDYYIGRLRKVSVDVLLDLRARGQHAVGSELALQWMHEGDDDERAGEMTLDRFRLLITVGVHYGLLDGLWLARALEKIEHQPTPPSGSDSERLDLVSFLKRVVTGALNTENWRYVRFLRRRWTRAGYERLLAALGVAIAITATERSVPWAMYSASALAPEKIPDDLRWQLIESIPIGDLPPSWIKRCAPVLEPPRLEKDEVVRIYNIGKPFRRLRAFSAMAMLATRSVEIQALIHLSRAQRDWMASYYRSNLQLISGTEAITLVDELINAAHSRERRGEAYAAILQDLPGFLSALAIREFRAGASTDELVVLFDQFGRDWPQAGYFQLLRMALELMHFTPARLLIRRLLPVVEKNIEILSLDHISTLFFREIWTDHILLKT